MTLFDQDGVVELARRAGQAIMPIWARITPADAAIKGDGSPLTEADLLSHRLIMEGLATITPGLPIVSEESAEIPVAERCSWKRFWLVDPLDGTKEFLARGSDFTVNIALIDNGKPVFGVVDAPALGCTYWGVPGSGAWMRRVGGDVASIRVADPHDRPVRVVASRRHRGPELETFLTHIGPYEAVDVGSSLKFCLVAEGRADIYPRSAPTMEWDTGAGHAVVLAAGGSVSLWSGEELRYGRENLLNPPFLAGVSEEFIRRLRVL